MSLIPAGKTPCGASQSQAYNFAQERSRKHVDWTGPRCSERLGLQFTCFHIYRGHITLQGIFPNKYDKIVKVFMQKDFMEGLPVKHDGTKFEAFSKSFTGPDQHAAGNEMSAPAAA